MLESDLRIMLIIGCPMLFNLALIVFLWKSMNSRFDLLHERISDFRIKQHKRENLLNRRVGDKTIGP